MLDDLDTSGVSRGRALETTEDEPTFILNPYEGAQLKNEKYQQLDLVPKVFWDTHYSLTLMGSRSF